MIPTGHVPVNGDSRPIWNSPVKHPDLKLNSDQNNVFLPTVRGRGLVPLARVPPIFCNRFGGFGQPILVIAWFPSLFSRSGFTARKFQNVIVPKPAVCQYAADWEQAGSLLIWVRVSIHFRLMQRRRCEPNPVGGQRENARR